MALIIRYYDGIKEIFDKHGDPRTKDWPLMSSPLPTAAICLTYIYLVKVVGPKLMENRKPFQLKQVLIAYNLFQVIFSTWLFYECLMGGWFREYSFICQPVDYSDTPTVRRMVNVCWWYYFSKFTEFMDTIFFVLRKKNEHISTLHVIHHGIMPMSVWFGVKFTPGGHSTFFGLLNTFVHIIMYTYYLLAAFGPQVQKHLWWKKYLTTLQMLQFIAIMVHAFQLLFVDCNYPKAFVWWIGMHAVMFFFLFKEFYNKSYTSAQRRAEEKRLAVNGKLAEANGHCNGVNGVNGVTKNGVSNGTSNGSLHKPVHTTPSSASDYYMQHDDMRLTHRA